MFLFNFGFRVLVLKEPACEIILCQLVVKRTRLAVKVGVVLINTRSMIFNEAI